MFLYFYPWHCWWLQCFNRIIYQANSHRPQRPMTNLVSLCRGLFPYLETKVWARRSSNVLILGCLVKLLLRGNGSCKLTHKLYLLLDLYRLAKFTSRLDHLSLDRRSHPTAIPVQHKKQASNLHAQRLQPTGQYIQKEKHEFPHLHMRSKLQNYISKNSCTAGRISKIQSTIPTKGRRPNMTSHTKVRSLQKSLNASSYSSASSSV